MSKQNTIPEFVSEIIEVGTGDFNDIPGYCLCEVIKRPGTNRRIAIYKKET